MLRLAEAGRGYWDAREGRDSLRIRERGSGVGGDAGGGTGALSGSPSAES